MEDVIDQGLLDIQWVVDYPHSVICIKKIQLLMGKGPIFTGYGESLCEPNDKWNLLKGKQFASIRAQKDIDNQIENYLIKQSCYHPKHENILNMEDICKDATIEIIGANISKDKIKLLFQGDLFNDSLEKNEKRPKTINDYDYYANILNANSLNTNTNQNSKPETIHDHLR